MKITKLILFLLAIIISFSSFSIGVKPSQKLTFAPVFPSNWSTSPTSFNQALDVLSVTPQSTLSLRPDCSPKSRGLLWLVHGSVGMEDTLHSCQKNADETYRWITK